ncbi:MAG: hypothetical protein K0R57_6448 [Paenibacillaceae bacterium]|jgi:hypothetical protein|nr:hypothetical protein [Paenibacillaceae bacterium]
MPEGFEVISDLYNRIFVIQTSSPQLCVDYTVWNRIFAALPQDYMLPDMAVYDFLPQK